MYERITTVGEVKSCGSVAFRCVCLLDPDHEPPHECSEGCGGSWLGGSDGDDFKVVTYPRVSDQDFMSALVEALIASPKKEKDPNV